MRLTISAISSLLLAPVAIARPRPAMNDGSLGSKSRITAFVVDEKRNPSVECWEIGAIESMQTQRIDGSRATSHAWTLRDPSNSWYVGVEVDMWEAGTDIWPPALEDDVYKESFDLSGTFKYVNTKFNPDRDQSVTANKEFHRSLFNVQGGLIQFGVTTFVPGVGSNDHEDIETHIFSGENGDDWFYFEDQSLGFTSSSKGSDKPYPFRVSTISASETEVLRLKYKSQPKHTVLHKGACSFTGIDTPAGQKSSQMSREHSGFTVQANVDDL